MPVLLFWLLLGGATAASASSAEPELTPMPSGRSRPAPARTAPTWTPPAPAKERPREPRREDELPKRWLDFARPTGLPYVRARYDAWFVDTTLESETLRPNGFSAGDFLEGIPNQYQVQIERSLQMMPVVGLAVAPWERVGVEAEYGRSDFRTAGWEYLTQIDGPQFKRLTSTSNGVYTAPSRQLYNKANAVARGRSTWLSGGVVVRALDHQSLGLEGSELDHSLDLLVGGEQYEHEMDVSDGAVTFDDGKIPSFFPVGTTFAGRVERSRSRWTGPHIGVRDELRVGAGFAVSMDLLYAPLMDYHGEIGDYLTAGTQTRSQNPQFTFDARGQALHVRANVSWTWTLLRLEAGYQRLSFAAYGVRQRTYNFDLTSTDSTVEHVTAEASGLYASASLRF